MRKKGVKGHTAVINLVAVLSSFICMVVRREGYMVEQLTLIVICYRMIAGSDSLSSVCAVVS